METRQVSAEEVVNVLEVFRASLMRNAKQYAEEGIYTRAMQEQFEAHGIQLAMQVVRRFAADKTSLIEHLGGKKNVEISKKPI